MTINVFKQFEWNKNGGKNTIFIRSAPLFLKIAYMLLQNKYIDKGVTNGLKWKKEKSACKTVLHIKIKKRRF